ncbi:MAG: sigma-70 family RNA polymerase sigma factor [Anaerolineae bacterium]|nr:sigma-70 family RNA polymerase sigma factor [Phycisphaerae bacterium]
MITATRVDTFDYQHWLTVACRHSRRASEAADLLQDSLLEALRAGKIDFSQDFTKRWFAGVIRNRAAMLARGGGRRKRRETAVAERDRPTTTTTTQLSPSESFVETLPPSARRVAVLVIAGLNRDEIIAALKIAPTAFRQRLTTIRRAWFELPPSEREQFSIDAPNHVNGIDLGLLRRALLENVRRLGGVGTHDPDGHLIVLSDARSQSASLRQQKGKENRNG